MLDHSHATFTNTTTKAPANRNFCALPTEDLGHQMIACPTPRTNAADLERALK
jgi:hypothetical protein